MSMEITVGTVTRIFHDKGYGFLVAKTGESAFFHIAEALDDIEFSSISVWDALECSVLPAPPKDGAPRFQAVKWRLVQKESTPQKQRKSFTRWANRDSAISKLTESVGPEIIATMRASFATAVASAKMRDEFEESGIRSIACDWFWREVFDKAFAHR